MKDIPSREELLTKLEKMETESSYLEQALRAAEDRAFKYENFLENMEDRYFEVDLKGNYLYVNKAHRDRLNIDPGLIKDSSYRDYGDRDLNDFYFKRFNQVYQTGLPARIRTERTNIRGDQKIYVENLVSLMKNREGEPIGFQGIGRDITEKKKMKEALRQSEDRYRAILENIKEGYYEMDLQGNFTFFNQALSEITGYPEDELRKMNYRQYIDDKGAQKLARVFDIVFATGKPIRSFEFEGVTKGGTQRNIEISISPLEDKGGEITGFRGLAGILRREGGTKRS